jgi:trehalose 6-phosphate phosphatase
MISCSDQQILTKVSQAPHLWLFLDYDGTLADFAATPDEILPDEELISLITALSARPDIRVTIISGRRLAHIRALLPVPGILKAGSYGLEMETVTGELVHHLEYDTLRPLLDRLKEQWTQLLQGRDGFYLEDKGWTLAIHGKDAEDAEAALLLPQAREQAQLLLDGDSGDLFRLLGGHRFLECGPRSADKKRAVDHLLTAESWHEDALLLYLGDDDKDEIAFEAIQAHGGLAVGVGDRMRDSSADCWLSSPGAVRRWLRELLEARGSAENDA